MHGGRQFDRTFEIMMHGAKPQAIYGAWWGSVGLITCGVRGRLGRAPPAQPLWRAQTSDGLHEPIRVDRLGNVLVETGRMGTHHVLTPCKRR